MGTVTVNVYDKDNKSLGVGKFRLHDGRLLLSTIATKLSVEELCFSEDDAAVDVDKDGFTLQLFQPDTTVSFIGTRAAAASTPSGVTIEQVLDELKRSKEHWVDPAIVKQAKECVFVLVEVPPGVVTRSRVRLLTFTGTAFFVSPTEAITAKHNFSAEVKEGDEVYGSYNGNHTFSLRVSHISCTRDFIKLTTESKHPHLTIHRPAGGFSPDALVGRKLILCAYQLAIKEHAPEFGLSMGVAEAMVMKASDHARYILYTTSAWCGDSGAALLLHNGEVVAMHLELVNKYKEATIEARDELDERIAEVEGSLREVMKDSATGYIALTAGGFENV